MQINTRSSAIGVIPKLKTRGTERGEPAVRSSMKASDAANDNLIDRTIALWQSRLGRDLSPEDARQIAANVTGFFSVLAEWSRAEMPTPANDAGEPVASDDQEVCHDR
jgi:hypothetical protein